MILRDFTTIFKDVTGGNLKVMKSDYLSEGNYPVIDQGKELIGGYSNIDQVVKRKGEVIVFGDHTGCLKFVNFDFLLGADGVKVIQPKYDVLDAKYAYYLLHKVHIPDTGYDRKFKYLKRTKIPLPPLPTQKKIANILDAADAHRQKTKQLLAKYDELAQSIFLEMFGDPVTNPKGWEVKKLGVLSKVSSGSTPKRDNESNFEGKIPWIKTGEVKGSVISRSEENISEKALKESSCRIYPVNTILIAMYGQGKTRGNVGLLGIEATTNQACAAIPPSDKINSKFLFYQLKMSYHRLRELGRGGNQPNLNTGLVKSFEVLSPNRELQLSFESRINLIEDQMRLIHNEICNADNLFNSLLQKAFKGELVK